jgi:hypothetical protein
MADNNGGTGLDLLTKATNDVAREIGEMDPDDPVRPERVKELYALTELIKLTKAQRNKLIYEKMDALAREIGALKSRDARRADIVNEIIRLSENSSFPHVTCLTTGLSAGCTLAPRCAPCRSRP